MQEKCLWIQGSFHKTIFIHALKQWFPNRVSGPHKHHRGAPGFVCFEVVKIRFAHV